MEIKRILTGVFETNTYILKEKGQCLIIDPSGKADKLLALIEDEVLAILLTHGHFDHIKAVDGLYDKYKCPIYIKKEDLELIDPIKSKTTNTFGPLTSCIHSPVKVINEGKYNIGPFSFEVYHTPGHTNGSVLYRFNNDLFTGDTLFKEGVGRTDLYGGKESILRQSLRIFKDFPLETIIYPGHGDSSTIEYELKNNPFLKII